VEEFVPDGGGVPVGFSERTADAGQQDAGGGVHSILLGGADIRARELLA
jgi:hypothetical protein